MLLAHDLLGTRSSPSLVLIHGITESRVSWAPLLDGLAADHRVMAVDLRGHGASEEGEAYDPVSYASDLEETVAAAGLTAPLVVGHSLGGIVASAYAAIASCRGVVNIDQPLQLSSFKESLALIEPLLRGSDEEFQQAIELMFQFMFGPLSELEQARLAGSRQARREVVMGTWQSVLESPAEELDAAVAELASGINVPYLSLHGIDPGPQYADWLYRLVPSAIVEVWADNGHYPHLVHPERFVDRLSQFEAAIG